MGSEIKNKYGLIVMGKKPVYFDMLEERQKTIKAIKGVVTYSTFTVAKERDKNDI